jgi:hypothetical protein
VFPLQIVRIDVMRAQGAGLAEDAFGTSWWLAAEIA